MVVVDVAAGRAVTAHHIIGIDLKLGLGVELGGLRQQQTVRRLLAVGLLSVTLDNDLALENAARALVHHAFEQLAAGAFRHPMIDEEARIGMLFAGKEIGTGDLRIRLFAVE